MAKCVVIGGNGFVGSYVVDELVGRGHEVTVFDRFSAGTVSFRSSGVQQRVGDFLNNDDLRGAITGQDFVFHFLSTSTPASAENDPTLDIRTNVSQGVTLLELAVELGVSRVFFASTGGAMYGDSAAARLSEASLPAPISPYAIGKQALEGYLRYFGRKHGLRSVSFRISNPYGPRQHPGKKQGVIPIFLDAIAAGRPVDVYGDGSAMRDYIFAADAARMMADVVAHDARHDVYNIGRGEGASLSEIVALMREVTGRELVVNTVATPSTYVERVVLDIGRFEAEFGAAQFVELRDGIERTWRDIVGRY